VDEAVKLFDATIADMGSISITFLVAKINYFPDGQDPIPFISDCIETMRISLWNTAFSLEFSMEKRIHKNKRFEDQVNFKQAMQRILFRYFQFILFPSKALARTPAFFATYLDKDSEDCMFMEGILKAWNPIHLPTCGWYLDCLLKRPSFSEVSLHESLEFASKGQVSSTYKSQAKDYVKKGGKRKKSIPEAKSSNVVVDVEALPKDVEASTVNIVSPSIIKKDEPFPLTQLHSVPSSNVSIFEFLSKLKDTAISPLPTSSWSTSLEFIINNSFVHMVEEKQHTNIWTKCYDDIVAFLTKVLIPISLSLFYHYFPTLYLYTVLSIIQHIFISVHFIMYLQLCEGQDNYFGGQLQKKPTVDLIILEYLDES
jgi:hypothetical protein